METPNDKHPLRPQVIEAIRAVYDPEIPVNVYDLGLIYEVVCYPDDTVYVKMTLTTPNCPSAVELPAQVESNVRSVPGVEDVRLELTFDPPFTMEMMSEEAKLELGLM
jgi:FeS assembly SUF system protein